MLSLSLYKIFHLVGIFLLLTTLGAMTAAGRAAGGGKSGRAGRAATAAHGIALLLILVSGFGMLARLGLPGGMPVWVWLKLGVWILLGIMPVLIRRIEAARGWLLYLAPVLGAVAAYLALYKPGS